MFDFFGWYEFTMLSLVAGAYLHGAWSGRKQSLEQGVELTLKSLEEQGIIAIDATTGEISPKG